MREQDKCDNDPVYRCPKLRYWTPTSADQALILHSPVRAHLTKTATFRSGFRATLKLLTELVENSLLEIK